MHPRSPDRPSDQRSWPMLWLLLVVIVPTVCVLWFMLAAIDNERVAVRQRLITAYRTQLAGAKRELAAWVQQEAARLDSRAANATCASLFAEVVRGDEADSLICLGGEQDAGYPGRPQRIPGFSDSRAAAWGRASRLEREGSFVDAAAAFSQIMEKSVDDGRAARALQAQARCLSKAGRRDAAVQVLSEDLARARFRAAADPQGRLIAPSAQLLALQLIDDTDDERFRVVADALRERLADYGEPVMPSTQRRFLMRQLQEVMPDGPRFDTLEAEDLAADFLESEAIFATLSALTRVGPQDHWQLVSPGGQVVALHREPRLHKRLTRIIDAADLPAEMSAELLRPGLDPDPSLLYVSFAADESLPGWRVALQLDEQALVDAATRRQIAVYLWTGLLVIAVIVAATGLIARAIRRQMRSTRIKNDLLATVSHELKTPLASMRLLVDTLLDGHSLDAPHVREYLELISKENNRLSRLVDNFLSFSRMERNKQQFQREELEAAAVVRSVTAAMGERFKGPDCRVEVEVAPGLPKTYADSDALVTAILNLLDNAYKYSGADKRIALSAFAADGHVCFAVRDNGIGLSGRAKGKIFERFYQVDRNLSRRESGCGLGLSIVQFIVRAHGGTVDVESRPGEGSTFTLRLPAAGPGHDTEASSVRQEVAG